LIKEPSRSTRLLNPIERISEILFGLIMALSFTCAISVVETTRVGVKEMLMGAIGCNIAWGLVDAIMFLMNVLTQKGRDIAIVNFVRESKEPQKAAEFIEETLSAELAAVITPRSIEQMRLDIMASPPSSVRAGLSKKDLKMALGIFLLVFISTFPVAIPFLIIHDLQVALRISNLVATILLFLGGWILAGYGAYNKFRTGLYMALIGIVLVALTISLGG
jgi:VIT1/CCC1 family predicted Fe2+/Mn2+ transporter